MRYQLTIVAFVSILAFLPGCEFLTGILEPSRTTVRLVNDGDFTVDVVLYIDDDQEVPREILTELGTRMVFTIPPGESTTFSRDCDVLQAIVIDNADLMVIGQVGPEADTNVLRDGNEFGCGDTIVFTFDHGPLLIDFDISVAVEP